jgi:hypothetical protein
MPEGDAFADLIRRVRGGDARAVARLVSQYEAAIRMQRVFDSMDICQSVLASFFVQSIGIALSNLNNFPTSWIA